MSRISAPSTPMPLLEQRRRRVGLWIGAALLAFAVAAVAVGPAYRWAKGWRARSLAMQAQELMAREKWQEAAEKAKSAVQLMPDGAVPLRTIARLYTRAGIPASCAYWKRLLLLPDATPDDRLAAAKAAVQFNELAFAQEQTSALLGLDARRQEYLELAMDLAIKRNDRAAALGFANRLLALGSEQKNAALVRAQLLFTSNFAAEREEGRRALEALAHDESEQSLRALQCLVLASRGSPEEAAQLAERLDRHPLATFEDRLMAVTVRIRLDPARRAELLDEAVSRFSGTPDALAALGRWLLQQNEPQRVLDCVKVSASLTRQDLFLVRLDALAALKRWDEITQRLAGEKVPVDSLYAEVFLARAEKEMGNGRAAAAHWEKAVLAAHNDPTLLLYLAQYATKVSETQIAEKAWRQLARHPAWAIRANRELVAIAEANGDIRGLRVIIRELARLQPDDPAPRNDAAYLDLLLEENYGLAVTTAEKLVREDSQRFAYRTTLALAYLRVGKPEAALHVYDGLNIPWDKVPAAGQAVHVAVLRANGRNGEADQISRTLNTATLKPEEQALLLP